MKKVALCVLLVFGVSAGLIRQFAIDHTMFAFVAVLLVLLIPVPLICIASRSSSQREDEARDALDAARGFVLTRREIRSRIPRNNPRRDSPAAFEGAAKIGAVRSMASLIRKPSLRMIILEVCDFADMVLETIRRMPCDSPAAVSFSENLLSRLVDALNISFEINAKDIASQTADAREIECFSFFITAIKKQQDLILFEGQDKS